MNRFDQLLQNALAKGTAQDVEYRRHVYETTRTLLLQKMVNAANPAESQKLLEELQSAIDRTESDYLELELPEISLEPMSGFDTPTQKNEQPEHPLSPSKFSNAKLAIALLTIAIAVIGGIFTIAVFGDSTGNQYDAISENETADITFSVGRKITEKGNAKSINAAGVLFIIDEDEDKNQFHQWLVRDVEAQKEHAIQIEWGKESTKAAYLQLQVIYSAKGATSKHYVYVVGQNTGRVIPKGSLAVPEFRMKSKGDYWVFEATTKTLDVPSTMQLIIAPSVGKVNTGSTYIRKLSVSEK